MELTFRLAEEHPALVQAASHIAADITKNIAGTSRVRRTSNSEDDDLMDIEPEVGTAMCFTMWFLNVEKTSPKKLRNEVKNKICSIKTLTVFINGN